MWDTRFNNDLCEGGQGGGGKGWLVMVGIWCANSPEGRELVECNELDTALEELAEYSGAGRGPGEVSWWTVVSRVWTQILASCALGSVLALTYSPKVRLCSI